MPAAPPLISWQLLGGWDVTVVERAPFLGAGVRTRYYGGHPYTFGPRHFLTPWEHIYHFLNTYVPLRRCQDHQFLTYVETDQRFYSYPIHADDIPEMPEAKQIAEELSAINMSALQRLTPEQLSKMTRSEVRNLNNASLAKNFEEFWIYSIGQTLYGKFVDRYSRKMWMIDDNKLIDDFTWSPKGRDGEGGAARRLGYRDLRLSDSPQRLRRLFHHRHRRRQGPSQDRDRALRHSAKDGLDRRRETHLRHHHQHHVAGSLFEKCHGELPYIGRDLHLIVLPIEFALPADVYFVYYAGGEKFTRVTEYKKFTLHKAPTTLISLEIPIAAIEILSAADRIREGQGQEVFRHDAGRRVLGRPRRELSLQRRHRRHDPACDGSARQAEELSKLGESDHG